MSPSQQLAQRRANKHALRVKQAAKANQRIKAAVARTPPNLIAGLPLSVVPGQLRDRLLTKSLKRQLAVETNPADWSNDQINELIFLHNTLCRALPMRPNAEVKQATQAFCEIVERIKERKRQYGHYGATGGEWQELKRCVNTMQTYLEALPGGILFAAEEAAGKWHDSHPGDGQ